MGNHLNPPKQPLSKRNSLPASSFSPSSLESSLPPPSRLSCHHLPYQSSCYPSVLVCINFFVLLILSTIASSERERKGRKLLQLFTTVQKQDRMAEEFMVKNADPDEEPINEKFVSRLKDIDGEVKNSRDKGLDTVGLDKLNVGFIGFSGSGRTTLIRSILGCPFSLNEKGETIIDKRSTFKKSRSVHFSETVSNQLVPFYFRHMTSIVLWEISYPFDALFNSGDQQKRMERREEKLRNFFIEQHLSKFCLLFVCVDGDEPREEDIVFARVARLHGKEVIFLKTKSDSLVSSISSQEEASSLLSREKIIFESKLASIAGDLTGTKTFFVCSRTIPTLIFESNDERIIAFRQMELLPRRLTINDIEGRRHTMEGTTAENDKEEPTEVIRLEEELLMRFILDHLANFPVSGRSF